MKEVSVYYIGAGKYTRRVYPQMNGDNCIAYYLCADNEDVILPSSPTSVKAIIYKRERVVPEIYDGREG